MRIRTIPLRFTFALSFHPGALSPLRRGSSVSPWESGGILATAASDSFLMMNMMKRETYLVLKQQLYRMVIQEH